MSLTETRIANARLAIERAGGVGKAAMGYEDSAEHGGKAREGRLRQVLQLLR